MTRLNRSTDPVWQRWEEVDRVFAEALERSPEQRETFLEARCGGDRELLDVVRTLLVAEAASAERFDRLGAPTLWRKLLDAPDGPGGGAAR